MRTIGILFLGVTLWALAACGGGDGGSNDTVAGDDMAATADTASGDDTAAGADTTDTPGTCVMTKASYIAMTRYVYVENADQSCYIAFRVVDKEGEVYEWSNMVEVGAELQAQEAAAMDKGKVNVTFPCDAPGGKCYAMEGKVKITKFEITKDNALEGGDVTGKKIAADVDVKATRAGNKGTAKFSFDLTF